MGMLNLDGYGMGMKMGGYGMGMNPYSMGMLGMGRWGWGGSAKGRM